MIRGGTAPARNMFARLYRRPWVGLLGLGVGFLTQPLGHTAYMVNQRLCGAAAPYSSAALGLAGLVVVWRGLRRAELEASWLGMLGGWLLWLGWFEASFGFFARLYQVPPYAAEPGVEHGYVASPSAGMLQSTVGIMLGLFVLAGLSNRQTRCNLMRWLHRNLRLDPGMPLPDDGRSFARITALELVFVTWFCYLFWLYAIYLGTRGAGGRAVTALYAAWSAWALYLVHRCTRQQRMAAALRYGIGAGIVLWPCVEMPAHFGAYREYWLRPAEYPLFAGVETLLFAFGVLLVARAARPRPAVAGP
jgi:hypothetical protein